jgi:hypothetical protein
MSKEVCEFLLKLLAQLKVSPLNPEAAEVVRLAKEAESALIKLLE